MGKKREMVRRCETIRELIDVNKYTLALEEIDSMNLDEVPSISDLYLFAELYEKAERMEKKKEIFYAIYERTHSRHILYQLLRLVIRLGEMEEARELFLAYEVVGGVTLDTFELRYRLARAEGEPTSRLIEILEDLKKEEYTEEWGYQLALLYEREGEREKCIHECEDLKLWFGEGKIVEKAIALKERCEAPDWQPPVEEEIPEPEEPEEMLTFASEPVGVTEFDEEEEAPEPAAASENMQRETLAEKEASVLVDPLAEGGAPDTMEMPAEDDFLEKALLNESIPKTEPLPDEGVSEPEPLSEEEVSKLEPLPDEGVSEPAVVKKEKRFKVKSERKPIEDLEQMLEDDVEDISEKGIRYHTLKNTIGRIKREKKEAHFVFAGGEERITLAVAKRVAKELNKVGYFSAQTIAKITAEKLNGIRLEERAEKLRGGCMLVTNAPELSKDAVENIVQLMRDNGENIVVMLSGPFDEMDCFLGIYSELEQMITYKVRM